MVLNENQRLLLLAAIGEGAAAADAYRAWRARVPLEDIDASAYRILGHVVHTAKLNRVEDPEMPRIKGVLKHTWISNMRRMRALDEAMRSLQSAGIEILVLKGAALFARYSELAAQLAVGDFDILVRRSDAPAAVAALMNSGFCAKDLPLELFVADDFEKLHALSIEHSMIGGSVDLHWWPLPRWNSHKFVDELFERSEFASLEGRRVRIPDLADHLFMTLVRSEPWESDEIFARAIETAQILRGSRGSVDWKRVVALIRRFHCNATAESLLALVRSELDIAVPRGVIDELRRSPSLLNVSELAIRQRPATERSAIEHFGQRAISLVRSHPKVSRSLARTVSSLSVCPRFLRSLHRMALEELPDFPGRSAGRVWKAFADGGDEFSLSGVDYVMGFSRPEKYGRWTEAYCAVMTVPVAADLGTRINVSLTATPLLAGSRTRSAVEICAGSALLVRKVFTVSDRLPATVVVEAEVIRISEFRGAVLALHLPDAARPSSLGMSKDSRLLGLCIQGIEVSAVTKSLAHRENHLATSVGYSA